MSTTSANELDRRSESLCQAFDPERFAKEAASVTDLLREYLHAAGARERPVWPAVSPDDLLEAWPDPESGPRSDVASLVSEILAASTSQHHPGFVGQQLSTPPSQAGPVAMVSAMLNNSSAIFEGAPVAIAMEHRIVTWMAGKAGYGTAAGGVLTSGGTLGALTAMLDCEQDYPQSRPMQRAVEWVLQQQVKAPGDWQVKVKGVKPGGWAFERANLAYPDIDDTAVALIVLARLLPVYKDPARLQEALQLAKDWIIAMQCRSGGWAAFDKNNDKAILTKIPFCDFGEALDPPSVDVTAHVLEAFGLLGMKLTNPVVRRAVDFIRAEQEPDGSWFGRWGVNYIYGTAAVLPALEAVGQDMTDGYVAQAADWILVHQNADGGWGETCGSYMDDALRGKGPSTASQTGWALMALIAVGADDYRSSIQQGVDYLVARQKMGTWQEPQYTGTGFPGYGVGARVNLSVPDPAENFQQGTELSRAFMINYNLYRHYFPLMALGRARRFLALQGDGG